MPPKIPLTLNSFRFNMLIDCSENKGLRSEGYGKPAFGMQGSQFRLCLPAVGRGYVLRLETLTLTL